MVENIVSTLVRWSDSGAVWRVVARGPRTLTVSMCSCDGLEEMQRVSTDDPEVIAWIGAHESSGDG